VSDNIEEMIEYFENANYRNPLVREEYYEHEYDEDDWYHGFDAEEPCGCCAARFLYDFPEYDNLSENDKIRLKKDVADYVHNQTDCRMVYLITNDNQPEINDILEELGFNGTGWMDKPEHEDNTCIQLWWFEPCQRRTFDRNGNPLPKPKRRKKNGTNK
jgi:hypothetical protein